MTLLGAASVAGLPPLPGFLGKLMILESATGTPAQAWVWAVVLIAGFLTLDRAGAGRRHPVLARAADPPK